MPATKNRRKSRVIRSLGERERQFAWIIRREGSIGRREIHRMTGVHPTLTGHAIARLIDSGLVCDRQSAAPRERGRPQIPLQVDADRRVFLGLAIAPGEVRLAHVDPKGTPRGEEAVRLVSRSKALIQTAATLLSEQIDDRVFSIGVSFTGVVSPKDRTLLFSSSVPSSGAISLEPIYEAAGSVPLILNNDMHAMGMRWLLEHDAPAGDVLIVGIGDGRLGASLLIDGRPHRGVVTAANELGHARLGVATDLCYCGQRGCLERVVSSAQLKRFGAKSDRPLGEVIEDPGSDAPALKQLLEILAGGIANAVNFIRPGKLVIASPMVRHPAFMDYVREHLPALLLPGIREQVAIGSWHQFDLQSAENAAWLALADVFGNSFNGTGA
jgi:predicted NBD/HSP70 family sugar kinase